MVFKSACRNMQEAGLACATRQRFRHIKLLNPCKPLAPEHQIITLVMHSSTPLHTVTTEAAGCWQLHSLGAFGARAAGCGALWA